MLMTRETHGQNQLWHLYFMFLIAVNSQQLPTRLHRCKAAPQFCCHVGHAREVHWHGSTSLNPAAVLACHLPACCWHCLLPLYSWVIILAHTHEACNWFLWVRVLLMLMLDVAWAPCVAAAWCKFAGSGFICGCFYCGCWTLCLISAVVGAPARLVVGTVAVIIAS